MCGLGMTQKELNEEYKQEILELLTEEYTARVEYCEYDNSYYNYDKYERLVSIKKPLLNHSNCFEYVSTHYTPTEYILKDVQTKDIIKKVNRLFKMNQPLHL